MTDILSYRFGSLNMIPDVTPNGVFYLPPTGWLTSFYNPPFDLIIQKDKIKSSTIKINIYVPTFWRFRIDITENSKSTTSINNIIIFQIESIPIIIKKDAIMITRINTSKNNIIASETTCLFKKLLSPVNQAIITMCEGNISE